MKDKFISLFDNHGRAEFSARVGSDGLSASIQEDTGDTACIHLSEEKTYELYELLKERFEK